MKCSKCQFENPEGFQFCGKCGEKLALLPEAEKKTREIESERKHVTILFSDLTGYTAMSERLDPEEVKEIMSRIFGEIAQVITKYKGFIERFIGDAVMAIFGVPRIHEDDPVRAILAAKEIHYLVEAISPQLEKRIGQSLSMHSGINTGLVVTGEVDIERGTHGITGDAINLASRLEGLASPGEILVSETTYRLVEGHFSFEQFEPTKVKGKKETINVYRVIAPTTWTKRFDVISERGGIELLGHNDEMDVLNLAFKRMKNGEPQVVDVVGEIGVGKSRLIYEFQNSLEPDATFLTGVCVHYGRNINFLPVIDLVKSALEIEDSFSKEEMLSRIEAVASGSLNPLIPFYLSLLGLKVEDQKFKALNPEGRKFGTFEAVKNLLLFRASEKPLVVFLEDAHWIDKISEELFSYLSRSFQNYPVLMLSAYRLNSILSWTHAPRYQMVNLETLSADDSIHLVRGLLGKSKLDSNLERRIVEKTSGNPFFIEEVVRGLLNRGDLVKIDDRFVSALPIDQLEIPDTVQRVLAARIDRLSDDLKKIVQVASVIGKDFSFWLLENIVHLKKDLDAQLSALVDLEFIYKETLNPEGEYKFRHALTQEAVYESLLIKTRQKLHRYIAQAIEENDAVKLERNYELLAHHWEMSDKPERAIEYLVLSGEKSNLTQAANSASDFFTRALNRIER